jgi:DNA-binding transcriptional regulator YiaG
MARLVTKSSLTRGERLLIARRYWDLNQVEAAASFGVSLYRYRRWEADKEKCPKQPLYKKLEDHEQCVILRRRHGLSRSDLAGLMSCSQAWVTLQERGHYAANDLVAYWKEVLK